MFSLTFCLSSRLPREFRGEGWSAAPAPLEVLRPKEFMRPTELLRPKEFWRTAASIPESIGGGLPPPTDRPDDSDGGGFVWSRPLPGCLPEARPSLGMGGGPPPRIAPSCGGGGGTAAGSGSDASLSPRGV